MKNIFVLLVAVLMLSGCVTTKRVTTTTTNPNGTTTTTVTEEPVAPRVVYVSGYYAPSGVWVAGAGYVPWWYVDRGYCGRRYLPYYGAGGVNVNIVDVDIDRGSSRGRGYLRPSGSNHRHQVERRAPPRCGNPANGAPPRSRTRDHNPPRSIRGR